jgi:flagellar biosynthesis/type III secretory pathway M-ring protein FliF/YscJ
MSAMAELEKIAMLVMAFGQPVVTATLCLVFLVLVARPVVKAFDRPKLVKNVGVEFLVRRPDPPAWQPEEPDRRLEAAAPRIEEPARPPRAAPGRNGVAVLVASDPGLAREKTRALRLFDNNTERAVMLLRIWLKQEA